MHKQKDHETLTLSEDNTKTHLSLLKYSTAYAVIPAFIKVDDLHRICCVCPPMSVETAYIC
jgi:hypothetical protein